MCKAIMKLCVVKLVCMGVKKVSVVIVWAFFLATIVSPETPDVCRVL